MCAHGDLYTCSGRIIKSLILSRCSSFILLACYLRTRFILSTFSNLLKEFRENKLVFTHFTYSILSYIRLEWVEVSFNRLKNQMFKTKFLSSRINTPLDSFYKNSKSQILVIEKFPYLYAFVVKASFSKLVFKVTTACVQGFL